MVAGKIGAVADRRLRMASKTAGAAEKMNGGGGKMEVLAVKTDDVAKKWKTIGKKDGGYGKEDGGCLQQICANVAGRRDKGCATFAQAGDVQMVSKLTAWNGRKRDDGRGFQ